MNAFIEYDIVIKKGRPFPEMTVKSIELPDGQPYGDENVRYVCQWVDESKDYVSDTYSESELVLRRRPQEALWTKKFDDEVKRFVEMHKTRFAEENPDVVKRNFDTASSYINANRAAIKEFLEKLVYGLRQDFNIPDDGKLLALRLRKDGVEFDLGRELVKIVYP